MLLAPWKTESDRSPVVRLAVVALFAVALALAPGVWLQAASTVGACQQQEDPQPTRDGEKPEAQENDETAEDGEKSPPDKTKDVAKSEENTDEVPRFTNDDLPRTPRMYESQDLDADDKKKKAKKKPGEEAGDEKEAAAAAEAMRARAAELRASIVDMEARLSYLERRTMAIKNPLLAGRTPADDTENAAVGGLGASERLSWVEDQIAATNKQLENARAELATLPSL